MHRWRWALVGCCAVLAPGSAMAQDMTLRVFLDCNSFFCDFDHFRRQIAFVNWVRDRQDAAVHVLVTQQRTGGGGFELTLVFLGLRQFAGTADTLRYVTDATDTEAEVRDGLTRRLALGLGRYVATTPVADLLNVTLRPAAAAVPTAATPAGDPWNFWVFEIGAGGSFSGEQQERGFSINAELSANRTTEAFKVDIELSGEYEREEFEFEPDETFVNTSENYRAELTMVWSLGDHWSAGTLVEATRSTFLNQDAAVRGGPAIEFNIFPYAQSTHRRLSLLYAVGAAAFDYQVLTVENRRSEVRPLHVLEVEASFTQPWGELDGGLSATQYLHNLRTHRIDTFTRLEIRLVRGLELEVGGRFSRIKDQFFLPAAGLTPEEILVRRRQRETDFRFRFDVGLSFRFGSAFTNVVNPRM